MKVFIFFCAAIAAISSTIPAGEIAHNFADLREKVTRKYQGEEAVQRLRRRSATEYHLSLKEFTRNVKQCDQINADSTLPYSCEYNEMSIKSAAEKEAMTGLQNYTAITDDDEASDIWSSKTDTAWSKRDTPASVDWLKRAKMGAAKNQGSCGSCWAFASVVALDINYYILTGEKRSFAEQEYLDCVYEGVEDTSDIREVEEGQMKDGCNGGHMMSAWDYNRDSDRMAEEKDLIYRATDGTCHTRGIPNGLTKAKVTGEMRWRRRSEGEDNDARLQTYVALGAVVVGMQCHETFFGYRTGVYTCSDPSCGRTGTPHAITIVGYGTLKGIRYWNVRNSWGSSWGEGGQIKLTRDDEKKNILNIHSSAVGSSIPALECREGQTCTGLDGGDEEKEEEEEEEEDEGEDRSDPDRGANVQCGKIVSQASKRCLSIDDSAEKYLDLSAVCERTWCLTDKGYLYEQATDMCANSVSEEHRSMIKLDYKCQTKWAVVDVENIVGIQMQSNKCCMRPDNLRESSHVLTNKACPEALVNGRGDFNPRFIFQDEKCWEVEAKSKLSGTVGDKMSDLDVAKETCMENEKCKGIYYNEKKKVYIMKSGSEVKRSSRSEDLAYVLVSCSAACKKGEERCSDGDCKEKCSSITGLELFDAKQSTTYCRKIPNVPYPMHNKICYKADFALRGGTTTTETQDLKVVPWWKVSFESATVHQIKMNYGSLYTGDEFRVSLYSKGKQVWHKDWDNYQGKKLNPTGWYDLKILSADMLEVNITSSEKPTLLALSDVQVIGALTEG